MNWDDLLDQAALAALLPEDYAHFARPVCEGLAVFLGGLSEQRQAEILQQQIQLSESAPLELRLGVLARCCPVLHKIGQILARDQRLALELREHLSELESAPPSVPLETIQSTLQRELGQLEKLGVTLTPPAIAEASVSVVIPFQSNVEGDRQDGVFKVLKPGIVELLEEELALMEQVGAYLDQRCDELQIPHLDYQDSFQQVRDKLLGEVQLENEQEKIALAHEFYAGDDRVQIPELLPFCTPSVTAMQRVWGVKVTDHRLEKAADRQRLGETIVEAIIARPIFMPRGRALFHCDPHAGNLFHTSEGRLAILDWSLVGWLEKHERNALVQLLLAALGHDPRRMVRTLLEMTDRGEADRQALQAVVGRWLYRVRWGQFPGFDWLLGLLDDAAGQARLRLAPDLMMFRKSLYALQGVVADVGAAPGVFDRVLTQQFLAHFFWEWPRRYMSLPNSRDFSTGLSNIDLTKAILGVPAGAARATLAASCDRWQMCMTGSKMNH